MNILLVFGCNPVRQFEISWIINLLGDSKVTCHEWWDASHKPPLIPNETLVVLLESGLIRLERAPLKSRLFRHEQLRKDRINYLRLNSPSFDVIHISDEESFDANSFYSYLPQDSNIWRNFNYSELHSIHPRVFSFPIGPRDLFIQKATDPQIRRLSSQREFPWAFLGTLWPSGSRTLAVSHFLRLLPKGYYFGGQSFGSGLPLDQYRHYLLNSVFALSPEGDRHLDTFRLWESLSCGCIPLVVDFKEQARSLLPPSCPIPVFDSWNTACQFAINSLQNPKCIDNLQSNIYGWWLSYQHRLSSEFTRAH